MKQFLFVSVFVSLLVLPLTPRPVGAADALNASLATATTNSPSWGQRSIYLDLGLGYLITQGTSSWEISFPGQSVRGKSALDFKKMDSMIPFITLELKHPETSGSIRFQYGKGQSSTGEGFDRDYQEGSLYHQSGFDITGETAFWIVDIQPPYLSFTKPRWTLKPFLGWQHYEEKIRMNNGRWITLYGAETDQPFAGLDSRYDFNWDALRLGIKGELELLNPPEPKGKQLRLKGSLALFPYIHYRGRGVWNLRDDFKKDPSFAHEADNFGLLGLDGALSLAFCPLKMLEIEGGSRIFYFYVPEGTNTTYFSNNTQAVVHLNEARALRIGLFFQITGRF